jgi:hypothetical protein
MPVFERGKLASLAADVLDKRRSTLVRTEHLADESVDPSGHGPRAGKHCRNLAALREAERFLDDLAAGRQQIFDRWEVTVDRAYPDARSARDLIPTRGLDPEFAMGGNRRRHDPLAGCLGGFGPLGHPVFPRTHLVDENFPPKLPPTADERKATVRVLARAIPSMMRAVLLRPPSLKVRLSPLLDRHARERYETV